MQGIDLSNISVKNLKIAGIDFRGTNFSFYSISPQNIYQKDLRNCKFDIYISDFVNFTGVNICGCEFFPDGDPMTNDMFNDTFKNAIYDKNTKYNGIPFTEILNQEFKDGGQNHHI